MHTAVNDSYGTFGILVTGIRRLRRCESAAFMHPFLCSGLLTLLPRPTESPKGQISLPGVRRKDRNMKMTMAEGIREMTLNELIRRLGCKDRQEAAMTAKKLRDSGEIVIEVEGCTVYSNGYVVYSNGTGRTVVFLGDCGSYTYHFNPLTDAERESQKQSETVDCFGNLPWVIAVTVRGDHQIEMNGLYRAGRFSDVSGNTDESKRRDSENSSDEGWDGKYHGAYKFPNPEEECLRREALHEKLSRMTPSQRKVYILSHYYGYSQDEIAEQMHISRNTVKTHSLRAEAKLHCKAVS